MHSKNYFGGILQLQANSMNCLWRAHYFLGLQILVATSGLNLKSVLCKAYIQDFPHV